MTKRQTAKDMIILRLGEIGPERWLAVHELGVFMHSQISLARRLYEMQKDGIVTSRIREGKAYKEWRLMSVLPLDKTPQMV
jgi:hypothetical protein